FRGGLGQVPYGSWVGDHALSRTQFGRCGERPRAGHLDLQWTVVVVGVFGEGVQVVRHQVRGTSKVTAGPVGDPPPAGSDLHGKVHQEAGGTADHVRADTAGG